MQSTRLVTTLLCLSLILSVAFASPLPKRSWKPSNPRESKRRMDDITQNGTKTNETGKNIFGRPFKAVHVFIMFHFYF